MAVGAVICLIVFVVLIMYISKKNGTQKTKNNSDDKKIELDNDSSEVRFSDEFKKEDPVTTVHENHIIVRIYMDKSDSHIWVCPNCEVENPSSKRKCYVCNYMK